MSVTIVAEYCLVPFLSRKFQLDLHCSPAISIRVNCNLQFAPSCVCNNDSAVAFLKCQHVRLHF